MIHVYSRLCDQGFLARRYYIVKYGFYYVGLVRNIGMFIIC